MKILLLGASNSLMDPGYLPAARERFAAGTGGVLEVDNRSVGAATCAWGVEVVATTDLAAYDAVMLDYAVTDPPFIARSSIGIWAACYESLLRRIRAQRPDIRVVVAYLRGISPACLACDAEMTREIHRLADLYGLEIFDADAHLAAEFGTLPETGRLYSDMAHYIRPDITDRIGAHLARHLARTPATPPSAWPDTPLAVDLTGARVMSAEELAATGGHPVETFANSAMRRTAVALRPGAPLELTLPGALVCATVVSTARSGTLKVTVGEGAPFLWHTLAPPVRDAGRPFIFRPLFALTGGRGGTPGRETRVRFEVAVPPDDTAHEVLDQLGLDPNPGAPDPVVHLSSVMVNPRPAQGGGRSQPARSLRGATTRVWEKVRRKLWSAITRRTRGSAAAATSRAIRR